MDKQINIHILAANNLFGKLKVKHIKINYQSEWNKSCLEVSRFSLRKKAKAC